MSSRDAIVLKACRAFTDSVFEADDVSDEPPLSARVAPLELTGLLGKPLAAVRRFCDDILGPPSPTYFACTAVAVSKEHGASPAGSWHGLRPKSLQGAHRWVLRVKALQGVLVVAWSGVKHAKEVAREVRRRPQLARLLLAVANKQLPPENRASHLVSVDLQARAAQEMTTRCWTLYTFRCAATHPPRALVQLLRRLLKTDVGQRVYCVGYASSVVALGVEWLQDRAFRWKEVTAALLASQDGGVFCVDADGGVRVRSDVVGARLVVLCGEHDPFSSVRYQIVSLLHSVTQCNDALVCLESVLPLTALPPVCSLVVCVVQCVMWVLCGVLAAFCCIPCRRRCSARKRRAATPKSTRTTISVAPEDVS